MTKMKKWTVILLTLALALAALTGCGSKDAPAVPAPGGIEGTPSEIIEKIYANHKEIDLALITMEVDLSDSDAVKYNLGLDSAEKIEAAAMSETMLGQPYSMAVVNVKPGEDAKAVAKQMFDGIDTRKWICVMADTKTAAVSGNTVVFFMISSDFNDVATTDSILAAFEAACGAAPTIIG